MVSREIDVRPAPAALARLLEPGVRERLAAVAAARPDVINLAKGDPEESTPDHVVQAGIEALTSGATHYTPWAGIPELRAAIARKVVRENGYAADPATEIVVTSGAQEALFLAVQLTLDPGTEAVVADPHYAAYDIAVAAAGASLVTVPTRGEDHFELDVSALERAISPRTRAILLVDPGNPVGTVLDKPRLEAIGALATRHGLWVIADEVYEGLVHAGQHHSPRSLDVFRDRTISIYSCSKSYAMTGWRVGYMTVPPSITPALLRLKYAMSICTSAPAQWAAAAALDGPQGSLAARREEYGRRLAFVSTALTAIGLPTHAPAAGFVALVDIRSTGRSSADFSLSLLERAGVLVMPGSHYGPAGEGFVRLSVLSSPEVLEVAIDRVREYLSHGDGSAG